MNYNFVIFITMYLFHFPFHPYKAKNNQQYTNITICLKMCNKLSLHTKINIHFPVVLFGDKIQLQINSAFVLYVSVRY